MRLGMNVLNDNYHRDDRAHHSNVATEILKLTANYQVRFDASKILCWRLMHNHMIM